MAITYIDSLNLADSIKKHALIDIDDLYLDKNNPRFSSSTIIGANREIQQSDIIEYLLEFGNISSLAESINAHGGLYDEEWISCYWDQDNHLTVLEGNRRITACKVLLNEALIPDSLNGQISIPTINKEKTYPNLQKIKALIYDNSQDAQSYIAAKHTKPEVKKWETLEQCNYYYEQFARGITFPQIAFSVGEDVKKVKDKIKQFSLFKSILEVVRAQYPDILVEHISILPLVTKFMPPILSAKSKIGLSINLDEETLIFSPAPEKADLYKNILIKIGEAFFVRNPATKLTEIQERSMSDYYRISTDEIKSAKKVEQLIIDNIRIPGLFDLIKKYKTAINTDYTKKEEKEDKTSQDSSNTPPPEQSTEQDSNNSSTESEQQSNNNSSSNNTTNTNNARLPEFFSDISFEHINKIEHQGVYIICDEIKRISTYNNFSAYKQFPVSSAFLLRSLIEQTLTDRLKQVRRYDSMVKTMRDGSKRSPELGAIIEVFLNDYKSGNIMLFFNDGNLAREFNKCFSGFGTKDQLDTIIHNPHIIQPERFFLNSLANQGLKLVIQLFLDHY